MTLLTIRGYVITKVLKSTTDSKSSFQALISLLITFEFWSVSIKELIYMYTVSTLNYRTQ